MEAAGDHGRHEPLVTEIDGTKCWAMTHEDDADLFYMRGSVDPDFLNGKVAPVQVQVTYWDSPKNGFFSLMYDALDNNIMESDKVTLSGSDTWKTHTFFLPDAKLQSFNKEYYSFRLGVWVPKNGFSNTPVSISRVVLQKLALLQSDITTDVPEGIVEPGTEVKLKCDEDGASIYYTTDDSDPAASDTRTEYSDGAPIVIQRATTIKAYAVKGDQRSPVQTFQYYLPSVSFHFDSQNGTGDRMKVLCTGDMGGDYFLRTTLSGKPCWLSKVEDHSGIYLMCDIDDGFTSKEAISYDITVEYFDRGKGCFVVQYKDSGDYVTTPAQLKDTGQWKSHTFHLENALLNNGIGGADFRIGLWGRNMGFSSEDVAFASVTVRKSPLSVQLVSKVDKVGNIFYNDEPFDLEFQLSNQLETDQNAQITYTVQNSNGSRLLSQDFPVSVPSRETVHYPLDLSKIRDYGTYIIQYTVYNADGGKISSEGYPFSRVFAQRKNLCDMFGACTHFDQHKGDPDKNFPIAVQAGIKWIRDEMNWSEAETTKGQVKVLPEWDEYIDTAIANGLEPLLILDYGNDLYGGVPVTDEAIEGYCNYCAVIAKHFKGRIKYFEIWNEWNIGKDTGTVDQYSKMMVAASRAIKEVMPDAYIIGGCTSGADIPWLQQMIDYPGAYEAVDAVSIHSYVYPGSPESGNIMGGVEQTIHIFGDRPVKPVWITETSWPTHMGTNGVPEMTSGAYAVRLYTWALANPDKVEHIFWYDLQNDGIGETNNQCNFGLIRSWLKVPADPVPWSAKENYAALSAFTSKVSDTDFVRKCDLGDGVYAYLFKKKNNGQDILILWSNGTAKNVGITLGDRPLQLSDMFGNSRNAATVDGTLTITLTDQPIYLEGTFADSLAPADSAFSVDPLKEGIVAGNEFAVTIHRSGSAQKLSGEYQVTLPEGWAAKDTAFSSGRGTDILRIEVPEGTKSGTYSINIHPVSENVVYGSLTLPIRVISQMEYRLIPSVTNGDWRKWKVALNIQNNTASKEMKGSARLLEPAKWNSNNDVIDFDIPAGKENSILFDVPDNPGPKLYTVKVEITQEGQKPTVLEKKISFLAAAKAECPIKVDGTLSPEEWEDAMPFTANDKASYVPLNGGQWGGPEDLSANGYLKWDKDNLYLAMNVTDDSHVQTEKGGSIWNGDSVQFCLDPGRSIAPGYYHTNDEIGFALNSQDNTVYHWKWASSAGDDLTMPDAGFSVVRKGTITSYEASIPWSDLVPDPNGIGENVDLGFSLLVNDSDPNEQGIGERKGFVQYMSGVGITKDMAQYGDLVLAERTNNPPETPEMEEIIQGYMEDGQLNSNLGDQLLYRVSIIQTMVDQKQFAEAVNYLKDLRSYISAPAVLQQGLITKDALDAINAKAQEWIDVLQAK